MNQTSTVSHKNSFDIEGDEKSSDTNNFRADSIIHSLHSDQKLNTQQIVSSSKPPKTPTNSLSLFFKQFASTESLSSYLKLEEWETEGNKAEAKELIIDCFRKRKPILDLSNLNLTSIPCNLNFPWIKAVNLSGNSIRSLDPLKQLQYLESLNLSSNTFGGESGIKDFKALKNLERLNSLILLNMEGDRSLLEERLKIELLSCEYIEWTDCRNIDHNFSKRPRELLSSFLTRRAQELSLSKNKDPKKELSDLEKLQDAVLSNKLKNLDISPLILKNPNIKPWIHRFISNDEYISPPIWKKSIHLRPLLAKEILSLLNYSMINNEFYENVFVPFLDESVTSCGDRTLYFLNEMIRRKTLYKAAKGPINEALSVFRTYFPVSLIKKIAQRSVLERVSDLLKIGTATAIQQAIDLEKEDLAVLLNFLVDYKAPLAFSEPRYLGIKAETRSEFLRETKKELKTTLQSSSAFIAYLVEDPDWQRLLIKKDPSFENILFEIKKVYNDDPLNLLEDDASKMTSPEYLRKMDSLRQIFKEKLKEAFKEETLKYIQ